jgi:hypothetical protein
MEGELNLGGRRVDGAISRLASTELHVVLADGHRHAGFVAAAASVLMAELTHDVVMYTQVPAAAAATASE